MRTLAILAALAGTATADPVFTIGTTGGYDTAAPGHREDGFGAGAGYRSGPITAELAYSYFDFGGAQGNVGGGAHRLGALLQARFATMDCNKAGCPHFDFDVGAGYRWLHWEPGENTSVAMDKAVMPGAFDREGREYTIGVSANVGLRFALHYVVFRPDFNGPQIVCRGTCPMQVSGDDNALLLEAGFTFGDR